MKALIILLLSISSSIVGCGNSVDSAEGESQTKDADQPKELGTNERDYPPPTVEGNFLLQGYVSSAFELDVDGQTYADSEDFYTQELDRLQAEAAEDGYDGYSLSFDAQIGLSDLKRGMRVFAVAGDGRGQGGETTVNDQGKFRMTFAADEMGSNFKLRANKRISVTLKSEDKKHVVKWCYNFSAVELDVDVTDNRPVILQHFVTRLTKYACTATPASGIQIPANDKAQAEPEASEETSDRDLQ